MNTRNAAPHAVSLEDRANVAEESAQMTHRKTTRADNNSHAAPTRPEHNRYAITLATLIASAQVPVAHQITEQPASPAHDYSSGFDTTGNDGDGQGDARGY